MPKRNFQSSLAKRGVRWMTLWLVVALTLTVMAYLAVEAAKSQARVERVPEILIASNRPLWFSPGGLAPPEAADVLGDLPGAPESPPDKPAPDKPGPDKPGAPKSGPVETGPVELGSGQAVAGLNRLSLGSISAALAEDGVGKSPVTYACLSDAAERFGLPVTLLGLLMEVESGRVGEISKNKNGSYDMGPMQINSYWLPLLKKVGLGERSVVDHGCVNVAVAAWILRSHMSRSESLAKTVSDYHSLNPKHGQKYLRAAKKRLKGLDLAETIGKANGSLPAKLRRGALPQAGEALPVEPIKL
ncbi:MAG: lytic transglycosylase domain-containing protein [Deltaproteobacteria bacterium]|jgi:hypothetical protein|nr:lytic transglycosylase domain-containing protein [Deltaproteobacteria bacterium]